MYTMNIIFSLKYCKIVHLSLSYIKGYLTWLDLTDALAGFIQGHFMEDSKGKGKGKEERKGRMERESKWECALAVWKE